MAKLPDNAGCSLGLRLSLPPMFGIDSKPAHASRAGSSARSWVGAALFSMAFHAVLFHLMASDWQDEPFQAPIDAYLAGPSPRMPTHEAASSNDNLPALPDSLRHPPPMRTAHAPWQVSVADVRSNLPAAIADPTDAWIADALPDAPDSDREVVAAGELNGEPVQASTRAGVGELDGAHGASALARPSPLEWRILQWLQQHRSYPRSALRARLEGDVGVRFVLDRGGRLLHAEVVRSSGFKLLDRAALDLLQRAQPYPLPPLDEGIDRLEMNLPVSYRIEPVPS